MPATKKLAVDLPPNVYRRMFWRKDQDGFGTKSWVDYFIFLTRDITNKQTIDEQITDNTRVSLLELWLSNFAENLLYIRHGQEAKIQNVEKPEIHTISELGKPEPEPTSEGIIHTEHSAIVIGAGPSITRNKHLELLAKYKDEYSGYIIATDKMLIPCLTHGIIPYITVTVDGSEIIKHFFDHPLVKKHASELKITLPTSVHPAVTKTVIENKAHIYWFNPMFDNWKQDDSYTKILYVMAKIGEKGPPLTQAGGNCGTTSWIFAWEMLKASPVALVGIDFGYPADMNLKETPYFSGLLEATKDNRKEIFPAAVQHVYTQTYHPFFKTWAKSDYVFRHYRKAFLSLARSAKPWVDTINCTGGGTLFGPRIDSMHFEDFLKKHKS